MEELESTVGLVTLDVLRIVTRSRNNRAVLLQLGVLPGLTRLMKVGLHQCCKGQTVSPRTWSSLSDRKLGSFYSCNLNALLV